MTSPWRERTQHAGWALLALRAFLALVFIYGGLSKIADRRFLDASSPLSMRASVAAVRSASPIGDLLGPVQAHSFGFGLAMAAAELAVGLGVLLGLLTRLAAVGGMAITLGLWLTVSWGATPWYTSADLVYLFAFTPLLISGSGGLLTVDAWLQQARLDRPGLREDRTRRTLVLAVVAVGGGMLLAASSLFRLARTNASAGPADPVGSAPQPDSTAATGSPTWSGSSAPPGAAILTAAADVPVGGAKQVTDSATDGVIWVLQLRRGQFTAYDATCSHQGCTVAFVSASDGFACPCHGAHYDARGQVLSGPAPRALTAIPVVVDGPDIRAR
ncbi:MAG: ubiquinol-cytochrome c reductase iron-sulfur subunit [Jatrophihabitantaceae bacterium]